MSEDGLDNLRLGQVTREIEYFRKLPATDNRMMILELLRKERDEILRRDNTVPTTPPSEPVRDMKATFEPRRIKREE